jgi:hypothetical protein
VVRSHKAGVVRSARQRGLRFGWQAGFYDHILRCNKSVNAVRDYIEKILQVGMKIERILEIMGGRRQRRSKLRLYGNENGVSL